MIGNLIGSALVNGFGWGAFFIWFLPWFSCWSFFGGKTLLYLIFFPLLFWVCMPYGICIVPLLVLFNRRLLHVVPMMIYCLAYFELILLSLVGLTVCGCNQIIQICGCWLIGGKKLLIFWANLDWLLPAVVICPTIGGSIIYLRCIVPLWSGFLWSEWFSLHCFLCYYLGKITDTWFPWL